MDKDISTENPCEQCQATTPCIGCWSKEMTRKYPNSERAWND